MTLKKIRSILIFPAFFCGIAVILLLLAHPQIGDVETEPSILHSRGKNFVYSVDLSTQTMVISGEGELEIGEGKIWDQYAGKVDKIILKDGITGIYGYLHGDWFDIGAIALVIPDSVTSFDISPDKASSYYDITYLYSNQNTAALEAIPTDLKRGTLNAGWQKFDYRSLDEIYSESPSSSYGWKEMSGHMFFVAEYGLAYEQWIYDDGKYYRYWAEGGSRLEDATEILNYQTPDNRYHSAEFTFDENGALVGDPPVGLMAATVESPELVEIPLPELSPEEKGFVMRNRNTYCYKDGVLQVGLQYIAGKAYYFESDGAMQKNKWVSADGIWYYLGEDGAGVTNCWQLKDGQYYYLSYDGQMARDRWVYYRKKWYYVDRDGSRCENAWIRVQGRWYYLTYSGIMVENAWIKDGDDWYYLGSDGAMLTDTVTPDGHEVDGEGRRK